MQLISYRNDILLSVILAGLASALDSLAFTFVAVVGVQLLTFHRWELARHEMHLVDSLVMNYRPPNARKRSGGGFSLR